MLSVSTWCPETGNYSCISSLQGCPLQALERPGMPLAAACCLSTWRQRLVSHSHQGVRLEEALCYSCSTLPGAGRGEQQVLSSCPFPAGLVAGSGARCPQGSAMF